MAIIIGVNPVTKKKRGKSTPKRGKKAPAKKRGASMAKGKKRRSSKAKTRTVTKYKDRVVYRYRAAKKKRAAKRVARKQSDPLELPKIVRGAVSVGIGMIVAKMAVNKLTKGGSETERWSWPNIAIAAVAGIAAGFALGAIFNLRSQTITLIALGGVGLAFYKAFTTKLAPQWEWSESWFGASDDGELDVYDIEDEMRAMGATDAGGLVVPANPALGATDSGGRVVSANPALGAAGGAMDILKKQQAAYPGSY